MEIKRTKIQGIEPDNLLAFICAPYAGDIDKNIKRATECAGYIQKLGHIPVTPHLLFPFIKKETSAQEREWALMADMRILQMCDYVAVFEIDGKITDGMKNEITLAKSLDKLIDWYCVEDEEVRNETSND